MIRAVPRIFAEHDRKIAISNLGFLKGAGMCHARFHLDVAAGVSREAWKDSS